MPQRLFFEARRASALMVFLTLCSFGIGLQACSSSDASPDENRPDGSSPSDAGTTPTDAASADTGSSDDSLIPQETHMGGSKATTCSAECAAVNVGCVNRCQFGATYASYGKEGDFGPIIVSKIEDPSCDLTVQPTAEVDGGIYSLATFKCCCATPKVTTVVGDVAKRESCNDVCTGAGFAHCGDFYDWQSTVANGALHGGVMKRYRRASTGSSYYLIGGCAGAPAATINAGGAERTLSDYRCACY